MHDWFTQVFGFVEQSPAEVRKHLQFRDGQLSSLANGRQFQCGDLTTPSLRELRETYARCNLPSGRMRLREHVGNVQHLFAEPQNTDAVFQVASQFNLLEMVSPYVTPEAGITIYQDDPTQGPSCAIACAAGTAFRNYFAPVAGQTGQSAEHQINCLQDVQAALQQHGSPPWQMKNGYALPTAEQLGTVNDQIQNMDATDRDRLRTLLRIGQHAGTQVTLPGCHHTVHQLYCSAMPVSYSGHSPEQWRQLATLILEAAYEATFLAAAILTSQSQNPTLYLTLLGGGAFGNESSWIFHAIETAVQKFKTLPMDVCLVSYRNPNDQWQRLCERVTRD